MEQAARRHADGTARYLAALERFPRPRGHEQRLLVQRVRRRVQAARDARAPVTE